MASAIATRSPLKLAIIGAGPSALYSASRLLAQLPKDSPQGKDVEVHVYERLPAPHGLVRYGVAPDHPEVKNVQHKFDLLQSDNRFRFFGNVHIGPPPADSSASAERTTTLPLRSLTPHYTHLLLSYGSSLSSSLRNVSGSSGSPKGRLRNVFTALEFVGWYNGHPSSRHIRPDLENVRHVTIIGQGNVALDCARILLKRVDDLKDTDIPDSVLDILKKSSVHTVEVVGRRGAGQVAFTTKEFREMMNLDGCAFEPIEKDVIERAIHDVDQTPTPDARMRKRLLGLIAKGNGPVQPSTSSLKTGTFKLRFLRSPKSFDPSPESPDKIGSITWTKNALLSPPVPPVATTAPNSNPSPSPPHSPDLTSPQQALAMPTAEEITTETDLVIESVGYRSEGLEDVPFDEVKGRIRNMSGRVVDQDGVPIPNVYSSGWVSRGPIGVIASTMYDAYSTMDLLLSDHSLLPLPSPSSSETSTLMPIKTSLGLQTPPLQGLPSQISSAGQSVISYESWKKIEQAELERGLAKGRTGSEKISTVEEMLDVVS
ncbi:Ferredoxin/adrenodoxin reductase [Phaffia rhodozyma]|uniref:NADPH:adrenodoxin oxidoreductase, mitochondrial n=1 Tax=Phaffia rhodozyma TaxID=264483 RepID=A0A0F7SHS8_PHARH|nr:Ferredoxin/adrenodoxin reductase [Phaffia rhodozyma]